MVITVTYDSSTGNSGEENKFRENIRNQFQERDAKSSPIFEDEGLKQAANIYEASMNMPFVRSSLRWLGGIVGVLLLTIGLFWFLSFFGLVLPWYSAFPLIIIIAGGAFIMAAITTRKRRN